MKIELEIPDSAPMTEHSTPFLQGMVNRMLTSFFKYGPMVAAFPAKVDAVGTLKLRLAQYEREGNTENLMDVANYAMIEFMRPRHADAHFRPQDSHESPGRVWPGEVNSSGRTHRVERLDD